MQVVFHNGILKVFKYDIYLIREHLTSSFHVFATVDKLWQFYIKCPVITCGWKPTILQRPVATKAWCMGECLVLSRRKKKKSSGIIVIKIMRSYLVIVLMQTFYEVAYFGDGVGM